MIMQRYGYYEKCLNPSKSFVLREKTNVKACIKSSKRFERKCCSDGVRQIEEGGIMCGSMETAYNPINFFGFKRKDGSDERVLQFSIQEKRGKITIKQFGNKFVVLSPEEFNESFTELEVYDENLLFFKEGSQMCMPKGFFFYKTKNEDNFTLVRGILNTGEESNYFPNDKIYYLNVRDKGNSYMITASDGGGVDRKDSSIWQISKYDFNNNFKESKSYVYEDNKLQRTIEYSGKSGDVLRFLYSEYKYGMAREAFTREFQIDLNEGSVGAYKGVLFEVIDATNTSIKYKVIRNFPVEP
jgi:hypothetical protein